LSFAARRNNHGWKEQKNQHKDRATSKDDRQLGDPPHKWR
jgi:hypothetical protein